MKVNTSPRNIWELFKNNAANIVTFIGFVASFQLLVLLWEVVGIYIQTGTQSWSVRTAWGIIALAIFAGLTDWIDGRIARSKWGKKTEFGKNFDKLRDKCLIAFTYINMIRSLYAVGSANSILYIVIRINITLAILILALDLILFVMGGIAMGYNYLSKNGKLPTDPTKWGKMKMIAQCAGGLFFLIALLSPPPLQTSMGSFWFMIPLLILLAVTNILSAMSIYGYCARLGNNKG